MNNLKIRLKFGNNYYYLDKRFPLFIFGISILITSLFIFWGGSIFNSFRDNNASNGKVLNAMTGWGWDLNSPRVCNSDGGVLKFGDSLSHFGLYLQNLGAADYAYDGSGVDWLLPGTPYTHSEAKARFDAVSSADGSFAFVMFGTNDCGHGDGHVNTFIGYLSTVATRLLDKGITPILSTIPPRQGCNTLPYNQAIIGLANSLNVPIRYVSQNASEYDFTSDGVHFNDYGPINNVSAQMLDALKECCSTGQCESKDPGTVDPSVPGTTLPKNETGDQACGDAGANTAWVANDEGIALANGHGMEWMLHIVTSFSELEAFVGKACGGPKTIFRLCLGPCELYDNPQRVASTLAKAGCDVYVTGYNEFNLELSGNAPVPEELYGKIASFFNDMMAAKDANVNILSPSIPINTPGDNSAKEGDIIAGLTRHGLLWNGLAGMAVNGYNSGGVGVSSLIENMKGIMASHGLGDMPIYITETGKIEQNEGVDAATAIAHLKTEFDILRADERIMAINFFNAFGQNPAEEFRYGNLLEDQDGNGRIDLEDVLGECASGMGIEPEYDAKSGCCQYKEEYAIKSCSERVYHNNGTRNDFNNVSSGVKMVPVSSLPPGDPNYNPASQDWEFRYAITERIHNFPLAYYLAADTIEANFADDGLEGSRQLMTHSAFLTQLNFNEINVKDIFDLGENVILQPDFTNQFEGIASLTDPEGSEATNLMLAMPSLGNIGGYGELSWTEFFEPAQYHCGFFYDKNGDPRYLSEIASTDSLQVLGESTSSGEVKGLLSDIGSSIGVTVKRWIDAIATGFGFSSSSLQEAASDSFLEEMSGTFGVNGDPCKNVCTATGVPIEECDYSDTILLPRYNYEVIIRGNPNGEALSPDTICRHMRTSTVVGGTCHFDNPALQPIDQLDYLTGVEKYYIPTEPELVTAAEYWDYAQELKAQGQSISGDPYWAQVGYPKNEDMSLQGLLKTLETTYEIEARYAEQTGLNICHYNNIGINILSTRTIWDAHGDPIEQLDPDFRGLATSDPLNFHYPPTQVFEVGSDAGRYGSCSNVKSDPFDPYRDQKASGYLPWNIANNVPNQAQGAADYTNSESSVGYIFPWIGQIPKMWERISYMTPRYTYEAETKEQNPFLVPYGSTLKEHLWEIYNKPEEQKNEAEKVVIPYCDSLIENGQVKRVGGEVVPNADCFCDDPYIDPLYEYLVDEGMLQNSFIRAQTTQTTDTDGDGVPDMCEPYTDDAIPPGSDVPPDFPDSLQDFTTPVDRGDYSVITQEYGVYNSNGCRNPATEFHTGVDLGTPVGVSVYASAGGIVVYAGYTGSHDPNPIYNLDNHAQSGYGQTIMINHGEFTSLYAHLSISNVVEGQTVQQGELIGYSGNTGKSSGPHLHFEIFTSRLPNWCTPESYVNPTPILSNPRPTVTAEDIVDKRKEYMSKMEDKYVAGDTTTGDANPHANVEVQALASHEGVFAIASKESDFVATPFKNAGGVYPIQDFVSDSNAIVAINSNFGIAGTLYPIGIWGGENEIGFIDATAGNVTTVATLVQHNGSIEADNFAAATHASQNYENEPSALNNDGLYVPCANEKFALIYIYPFRNDVNRMHEIVSILQGKGVKFAVTGLPIIVSNGTKFNNVSGYNSSSWYSLRPRTILGWNGNGDLIMSVLNRANIDNMASVGAEELGMTCGIGLDGGGSSQMYYEEGFAGIIGTTLSDIYSPDNGTSVRHVTSYIGVQSSDTPVDNPVEPPDPYGTDIPDECLPYVGTDPLGNPTKDFGSYECLMRSVVDFINSKGYRLPVEVLYGALWEESRLHCNGSEKCTGNPNEIGHDYDNGYGVVGVAQFKGSAFSYIVSDTFWWRATNTDDIGVLLDQCVDYLGVDRTAGQEDNSEYEAFWAIKNKNGEYVYSPERREEMRAKFSRRRVGDSLCAMAIMLSENAAGGDGVTPDGVIDYHIKPATPYITEDQWWTGDGKLVHEHVSLAYQHYYGDCVNPRIDPSRNFCDEVYEAASGAIEEFKNLQCTTIEEHDADQDEGGDEGQSYINLNNLSMKSWRPKLNILDTLIWI